MFKKCNFCGKRETPLNPMLSSMVDDVEVSICKLCVTSANKLLEDKKNLDAIKNGNLSIKDPFVGEVSDLVKALKKPKQIHKELNSFVIGQHSAKMVLSTAIYNHYKRVILKKNSDITVDKSNILMIGPSGSGKTYISKKLAEIMDVPIIIADATSLTQTGYIGSDVESMLTQLYIQSGHDIAKTERGIIFIDEVDKIAKKVTKDGKDSTGEGVQQNLLKMIEGNKIQVPPEFTKNPHDQRMIEIDTTNILFIMSGVFDGLVDIIKERQEDKKIGFDKDRHTKITKENEEWLDELKTDDLVEFGFLQEFLGRVPVTVTLDELTKEDLVNILKHINNSLLEQYTNMFEIEDVELVFDDDAIDTIADKAIETKVGARGLKKIMEKILTPHMYDIGVVDNIIIKKENVIMSLEQKHKDLTILERGN